VTVANKAKKSIEMGLFECKDTGNSLPTKKIKYQFIIPSTYTAGKSREPIEWRKMGEPQKYDQLVAITQGKIWGQKSRATILGGLQH